MACKSWPCQSPRYRQPANPCCTSSTPRTRQAKKRMTGNTENFSLSPPPSSMSHQSVASSLPRPSVEAMRWPRQCACSLHAGAAPRSTHDSGCSTGSCRYTEASFAAGRLAVWEESYRAGLVVTASLCPAPFAMQAFLKCL